MKAIQLFLVLSTGVIWGLSKKQLFQKKLTFSQFAIQERIHFKPDGTYELYLENAASPRYEKGKYKIKGSSISLTFKKCESGFSSEELTGAEKGKEDKFSCSTIWGDLKCHFETANAVTYSEVMICDRKDVSKRPKDEKSPLMVLQNVNTRPKPNDIVQIGTRNIRILPEKPTVIKHSTNIFSEPDESKIRACPGPVACKAPYMTEVGKQMHPHGITVEKYPFRGKQVYWYVHGSDEYGLWYLPETGVE